MSHYNKAYSYLPKKQEYMFAKNLSKLVNNFSSLFYYHLSKIIKGAPGKVRRLSMRTQHSTPERESIAVLMNDLDKEIF